MKSLLFSLFILASAGPLNTPGNNNPDTRSPNSYSHKITFKVADVKPSKDTLYTQPYRKLVDNAFVANVLESEKYSRRDEKGYVSPKRYIECFSRDRRPMEPARTNGFFEAAHQAYGRHHALTLSPDMIWLVISQGFALHINQNSEAMRKHFVQHEGKKILEVDLTEKIKLGDDNSDWEGSFVQFHDLIAANTSPELAALVAGRFSGTNTDAAVAFDITLMDVTKSYFDFWGGISCGIPEITLEGTPEDWKQLEQRAAQLARYDLEWWVKDLQPILAEFTQTANGQINRDFWKSMIKDIHQPICGGDTYITGWIAHLFPYIKKRDTYLRNPLMGLTTEDLYTYLPDAGIENNDPMQEAFKEKTYNMCEGNDYRRIKYTGPKVTTHEIPSGISTAILNINDNGTLHKMELKAGFFGMRQEPGSRSLRPEIGWAVIETGEQPDKDVLERYQKHQQTKKD